LPGFAILRDDWVTPDVEIISAPTYVGLTVDSPVTPVGGKESLKLSPAEVAAALIEHIVGDEEGEEWAEFLACVAEGARTYGVRGSTVTSTASADVLVDPSLGRGRRPMLQIKRNSHVGRNYAES